jgi:hypothetical protein
VTLVVKAKVDEVFVVLTRHSCDVFSARPVREFPDGVTAVPEILE